MKLTVKALTKRLALYPAGALREVLRALDKIEARRGIECFAASFSTASDAGALSGSLKTHQLGRRPRRVSSPV